MSLPVKYQQEIIDKLINDFPLLVFNMKQNAKNKVLNEDQYFSAYFTVIKDKENIKKQIKAFNKQFPLPYESLMSFQTGRMIIDVDNLISDTYGILISLTKQRTALLTKIKDMEKKNSVLTKKLREKHEQLQIITEKFNECKKTKDKYIKIADRETKKVKASQKQCSLLEDRYNKEVLQIEEERDDINQKIILNDDGLDKIKKELDALNQKIDDYSKETGINLENEMNKPKYPKKVDKKRKKKKNKQNQEKPGILNTFKFW